MENRDNNIMLNMAAYNFNKPVHVTLTFYDSDEEVSIKEEIIDGLEIIGEKEIDLEYSKKEINQDKEEGREETINNSEKVLEKDKETITETVGITENETMVLESYVHIEKQSQSAKNKIVQENHTIEKENAIKIFEKEIDRLVDEHDKINTKPNLKTKRNSPEPNIAKIIRLNDSIRSETNEQALSTHSSVINSTNNSVGVQQSAEHTSVFTSNRTSNSNCQLSNVDPVQESNQSITRNNLDDYILNSLKLVSDHIIFILKEYSRYVLQVNSMANDPTAAEKYHKYYLYTKEHFFNLSYSITLTVLLPNENNTVFIDKFYNQTLQRARRMNCTNITKEHLVPLVSEIIYWTKHKKSIINSNIIQQYQTNGTTHVPRDNVQNQNSPLLSQFLKPVINSNVTAMNESVSKKLPNPFQEKVYNYTFGNTPGKQISIQVDPSVMQNKKSVNVRETSNIQPLQNNNSTSTLHQSYINNTSSQFGSNSTNNKYHQYVQPTSDPRQTFQQQFQDNYQKKYQPSNNVNASFNTSNTCMPWTSNSQGRLEHSYRQPQFEPIQQQVQPETTRSLSTDSGFMSPPPYCSTLDVAATLDTRENLKTAPQTIPLITHVTSLHPKAAYNTEGICNVCKKGTKLKCLACLQSYYCSFECQQADWVHHETLCKRQVLQ